MKYNYKFYIQGSCKNSGEFTEPGEGSIMVDNTSFDNEARLHLEMIKDALEAFISVTQPIKKYELISELSVKIEDIVEF
jgi:hypothetical protein